jgi:flagellar hook protein FlgE
MSIFGGLRSGVSGLNAQSQSMGMISDNIANVNTVGYKVNNARFSTLVTAQGSSSAYASGGVGATTGREISAQGLLASSTKSTDLAISGNGFFAVTDGLTFNTSTGVYEPTGDIFYTRAGEFRADKDGNLVNTAGFYLMGFPKNTSGNGFAVTNVLTAMQGVNVAGQSSSPISTSAVSLAANLQDSMATGDSYDTAIQIFDRKGAQRTLTLTFTKSGAAANTFTISAATSTGTSLVDIDANDDGTIGIDDGTPGGTAADNILSDGDEETDSVADTALIANGAILGTITFNANGTLASVASNLAGGNISASGNAANGILDVVLDYDNNAATSDDREAIAIDFGTIGGTNGLTQFEGTSVLNDIDQNGKQFGSLSSVSVNELGVVTALFDNGESRQLFQVPLVTFNNADGLKPGTGNVYSQTDESGQAVVKVANTGGAGLIAPASLEQSTVDLADEFTKLIVTQRAFSANTKIITTADEMLDELIRVKR